MSASPSNCVTIVSGLPRSGTSLMMQMLASGGLPSLTDQLRAADEDNPRGYLEFEAVKQTKASSEWLKEASGKAVKMVHLLLLDLPLSGYRYRVVLMKRKINEVLASQRVMLQRHGKAGAALNEQQLAQIFETQMSRVENFLKSQPQFSYVAINYNELMLNPEPQIETLNNFFGGELDKGAMAMAIDPNLHRQK